MTLQEIAEFLTDHGQTIAAFMLVTPAVWLTLHFLFRHRVEDLQTQKETLKQQNEAYKQQNEAYKRQIDSLTVTQHGSQVSATPAPPNDIAAMIADWTTIAYEIKAKYLNAMNRKELWPGESSALVEREGELYARVLARLDRSDLAQNQLASEIQSLRNDENRDLADWIKSRDRVLGLVGRATRRSN